MIFQTAAPDLWSYRALVVRIEPSREFLSERIEVREDPLDLNYKKSVAINPETAIREAAGLRGELGKELILADVLDRAAQGFFANNNWLKAEEIFREVLELRKNNSADREEIVKSLLSLGRAILDHHIQHSDSRLEECRQLLNEASNLAIECNNRILLARSCYLRGWIARMQKKENHEYIAKYYTESALEIYQQLNDVYGSAHCYSRLADLALEKYELETAQKYYHNASDLYQKIGDVAGAANCLFGFAECAYFQSDYEGAKIRYEQAIPEFKKIKDTFREALCHKRLGEMALLLSNYDNAKEHIELA